MDLTHSYISELPPDVAGRYSWREVRNATSVLRHTNPDRFDDIMDVLRNFKLTSAMLLQPGGNKSLIARNLDEAFRVKGWREARVDVSYTSALRMSPYRPAGETGYTTVNSQVDNEGYMVDNFYGRVALDVEWNAKDGNLDRDLSAYRMLYDLGFIDCAVLVTRAGDTMRDLVADIAAHQPSMPPGWKNGLATTTTTNLNKLIPRMTRGDAGGCPLLAVAINESTWDGNY